MPASIDCFRRKKSEMLVVGELAVGRYFWLRHDQVVGRDASGMRARLSKERRETHINLGITTQ